MNDKKKKKTPRMPRWKSFHHSWTLTRRGGLKSSPQCTKNSNLDTGLLATISLNCHRHGVDSVVFSLLWDYFLFPRKLSCSPFSFHVAILSTVWFLIYCIKAKNSQEDTGSHVKERNLFPARRNNRWRTIYPVFKSQMVNLEGGDIAEDFRTLSSLKNAVV